MRPRPAVRWTCRRTGSWARDDRPAPVRSAHRCSAGRSTSPPNPCRHAAPRTRPPLDGRGRDGRDRRRGRGRQDGPAARRAVRHARLVRDRGGRQPRGRRDHQRGPLARRRRARPRRAGRPRPRGGPAARHARRHVGRPRGGRGRPDRARHAGRGAAARLPVHGCRGRLDRARDPRREHGDLRDDAPDRRHAASASRRRSRRHRAWSPTATSSSPSRPNGSSRAPSWRTSRSTRSWSAGSVRPPRTARRASTRACSTRRSWR